MTNEQAIDILTEVKYFDDSMYQYNPKYMEALDMAIEALKELDNHGNCVLTMFGECSYQETGCSDCKIIGKIGEALKNEPFLIDALHKAHAEIKEMDKHIEELNEERPQGEWIPVSERLPEEEGDYLLWGKIDESEEGEYSFIGSYDEGCEQFGIWQEQFDSRTLGSLGSEFYSYSKVVAWQSLPKPYKMEADNE